MKLFLLAILSLKVKGDDGGDVWKALLPQYALKFAYAEYYGTDKSTCIVGDNSLTSPATAPLGAPSLLYCDGKYEINAKRLTLPRNTIPICAYYPILVNTGAINYRQMIDAYSLIDKPPNRELKQRCLNQLSVSSKSRFKVMYGVDTHDTACMRYAEINSLAYGSDPEIKEISHKIESLLANEIKWRDTAFQADMIISVVCVAINKQTCIRSWDHLLREKNNSVLNLLGFKLRQTPSTWLYADGIDIELLHLFVEIMGMDLQTIVVDNIPYHHISPSSPSGPFVKHKPGLVGGPPSH